MKKIIFISMLIPFSGFSQNTKTDKVVNQVNSAIGTAGNVLGLFKKNKSKENSTDSNVGNNEKTSGNLLNSLFKNLNGKITFAGKVTNQTKLIDFDQAYPFNRGAAVIKKGNSYALIDKNGDFLVPFNKYENIYTLGGSNNYYGSGIFSTGSMTYINYKGKAIYSEDDYNRSKYLPSASFDNQLLVLTKSDYLDTTTSIFMMDADGKKSPVFILKGSERDLKVSDSTIVYHSIEKTGKILYGFKNFNGSGINPRFDELEPFSNGVAVFGIRNEYGETKYGVVNKKGEMVFPAQFSNKPWNFKNGFSWVQAGKNADFESAIINTKGEIFYKNPVKSERGKFRAFDKDYAFDYTGISGTGTKYILGKNGDVYKDTDFFSKIGISICKTCDFQSGWFTQGPGNGIDDKYTRITFRKGTGVFEVRNYPCLYNFKTGNLLIADLSTIEFTTLDWGSVENAMYVDPISGLIRASIVGTEKDRTGKNIPLDGWINEKGEFVLLKGKQKSDF